MFVKIKERIFTEKTTERAVFFGEAVCDGIELYDVLAIGEDKVEIMSVLYAICTSCRYATAVLEAAEYLGIKKATDVYGYFAGSRSAMIKKGIDIPYALKNARLEGLECLYLAKGGEIRALALFRPKILRKAAEANEFFLQSGISTALYGRGASLLGVGKRMGISDVHTSILKIEREKVLQELKKHDKIFVIEEKSDIENSTMHIFRERKRRLARLYGCAAVLILTAFCIAFSSLEWLLILACLNTAVFIFTISFSARTGIPELPYVAEEEKMFGKVQYTMQIGGMSCAHCLARVKSTLESIRGVSAAVSLEEKTARIKCPASLDVNKLSDAVTEAGFKVISVEKV